ncbi:hypothetical protein F5144DRAFT_592106 [Chaetomium tenue]|uniref:Uncharacterized protein n=1 Tax=Chaetomium tenue TaxID=1854479 RepID=A0ACB7PD85_9PEZI|nr:hypothetical protein F5144DRAFT_592106 [Chaetomium globosum]
MNSTKNTGNGAAKTTGAGAAKTNGTGAAKATTSGNSRTAQAVTAANGTSKAAAALKAAVTSKNTETAAPAKPSRGNSSVEVEFLANRVVYRDYQMGDLIGIIEEAAAKLGMTGKVTAACLSHEGDQGNGGRSTWKVELRKPIVANCDQLFVLRIRTQYEVPSLFGRK